MQACTIRCGGTTGSILVLATGHSILCSLSKDSRRGTEYLRHPRKIITSSWSGEKTVEKPVCMSYINGS